MSTVLEFACEYIAAGIKCIPVRAVEKIPRNSGWQKNFLDIKKFESYYHPGDGIGIVTGKCSGIICIDIDNKPDRSAVPWYHANIDMLGNPLVEQTPSGGYHLYYKYPDRIDFLKSNKDKITNGLEVMADGGKYVITAPSSNYTMHNDIRLTDLVFEGEEPPRWLLEQIINLHQRDVERPDFQADIAADESRCIEFISRMPPAISGQSGDQQTFAAACRCRDFGLTQSQAFEVLSKYFNPRCLPPWSEKELRAKIKNGYKYNKNPIGSKLSNPADEFGEVVLEQSESPKVPKVKYVKTNAIDFVKKDFPPREHIIGPFVKQGLNMVYAPPGVGKTYFAMGLCYAIATGGEFLRWKCEKIQKVIYFDGELPAFLLKGRLQDLFRLHPCDSLSFDIVTPDEQPCPMPDFATSEGQEEALGLIGDAEFIVIDNISTLCRTGKENEAESWIPVQNFLLKLRRLGKSVLLVHHSGKGEVLSPRGTSKREDTLDLVISLSHPADYKAEDACSFQMKFRKSRHFRTKEDIEELKASYNDFGWTVEELEQSNFEKVKQLLEDGVKQRDISEMTGLSKGHVSKLAQKVKKESKGDSSSIVSFHDKDLDEEQPF